jgi:hypothetical protein
MLLRRYSDAPAFHMGFYFTFDEPIATARRARIAKAFRSSRIAAPPLSASPDRSSRPPAFSFQ